MSASDRRRDGRIGPILPVLLAALGFALTSAPIGSGALADPKVVGAAGFDAPAYDRAVDALTRRLVERSPDRALSAAVAAVGARFRGRSPALPGAIVTGLRERRLVLLRVPGLFHRSHPETGADLAVLERLLATDVPQVETDEVGTVEANAALVAAAIREHARDGRRIALVSVSKGSAEVRTALEREPALAPSVALWLDLVGVLEGTPLTDPDVPWQDTVHELLPPATARSLSHRTRSRIGAFPPGVAVAHVAAFPHAADVSEAARAGFLRLRERGPNDGYVLLDALLRAPGRVVPVRGADHYLRIDALAAQMASVMLALLEEIPKADRH